MPIEILERYKLIFEEHHYASDFRVKIFTGWCIMYAGLAAAFVWVHSMSKSLCWVITVAGSLVTALMWLADVRNRSATRASKDAGVAIEKAAEAGIPAEQRFFERLETTTRASKLSTHSRAIDLFASLMIILLGVATRYLWLHRGTLP
jgi:hypothetical protein